MQLPLLSVSTVLLAMAIGCTAVMFQGAFVLVVRPPAAVLTVAVAGLILRAVAALFVYYGKLAPGVRLGNIVLALAGLVTPLGFGAAGIQLLTGQPFWQSGDGLALFVVLCSLWLAQGIGFVHFLAGRLAPEGLVHTTRGLNVLFAAAAAIAAQCMFRHDYSHLFGLPYAYFAVLSAATVLWQAAAVLAGKEWRLWWYLTFLACIGPALLLLANHPYLIFPTLTLNDAYNTGVHGVTLVACYGLALAAAYCGVRLVARSLSTPDA